MKEHTPEIREQMKQLLRKTQQEKLVESYKFGSGLVLKTGRGQRGGFLGSLSAGIRIPLIANVVGKLFGACHGKNKHEDEDEEEIMRIFKSPLLMI